MKVLSVRAAAMISIHCTDSIMYVQYLCYTSFFICNAIILTVPAHTPSKHIRGRWKCSIIPSGFCYPSKLALIKYIISNNHTIRGNILHSRALGPQSLGWQVISITLHLASLGFYMSIQWIHFPTYCLALWYTVNSRTDSYQIHPNFPQMIMWACFLKVLEACLWRMHVIGAAGNVLKGHKAISDNGHFRTLNYPIPRKLP